MNIRFAKNKLVFEKNYSTIDHLFTLVSMIKKCLYGQRRSKLYVAFIDYLKAFDSVDRDILWVVLQKIQTSTKMLCMLQGIYNSVQSCVRWGPEMSEFFLLSCRCETRLYVVSPDFYLC